MPNIKRMDMAGNLWWCSLLSLLFMTSQGTPVWSQGFELSSHSDVVRNAMHLYGPPVPSNLSLSDKTQIPPLISDNGSARIFPCMNFTCSGMIKKLIFVALYENLMDTSRLPIFALWNTKCISEQCIWVEKQRLNVNTQHFQLVPIMSNISRGVGVYELVLTSNISFHHGDCLGVRRPFNSTQQPALLYQRDGGYCNAVALEFDKLNGWIEQNEDPILPYIATETDESSRSCAVGFLNRESLHMIVDATRDDTISKHLNFIQNNNQNMQLGASGSMIKFIIAAKFNHSDPSGWPILQIRREGIVTAMTQLEPRPTGYLNVFEYEPLSVDVQPGDVVSIRIPESSGQRYLLAYLTESSVSKPMVHANISIDSTAVTTPETVTASDGPVSSIDSTTVNIPGTTTVTTLETVTLSDGPASSNGGQAVVAIAGGVFGTLVILSLLAVLIITVVLTYRCRGKTNSSTTPSTAEVNNTLQIHTHEKIEMDTNEAYIANNFPTEPNIAYGHVTSKGTMTQDYDYVVM